MPILKGTATFSRFRVDTEQKGAKHGRKDLAKALHLRCFTPLQKEGEEERAQGFVELENKDRAEFTPGALYEGPFAVFAFRVDEIRIPSAAVRSELDTWEQRFEAEHERPASKKEKSDAKEEIRFTLKSRYPVTTKLFDVSWNLEENTAQIWAGSRKAVDEVQAAIEQALSVKLIPIAPATIAAELGIAEKALAPTPSLSMPEEVANGTA